MCFSISHIFFIKHIAPLHRYESEFFQNVVNGHDIVSWAAVDRSRPNGQSDELIGFVTARIVLARESEVSPPVFLSFFLFFGSLKRGLELPPCPSTITEKGFNTEMLAL